LKKGGIALKIVDLKHPDREFPLTTACGLCLGNFDGVHRGHRALIKELQTQNARLKLKLPLGALLFAEPPGITLGRPVPQLTTTKEKLELLLEAGLRFAILLDFAELQHMPPDDFVQSILIEGCNCRLAVCGFNYSYGARGAGTPARLAETFGAQPDRHLHVVPAVVDADTTISSTRIRATLENGHPEEATRLMGHPYFITGTVAHGRQIGSTMGFPTANLSFPKHALIPAHGVYVSTVRIARRNYTAITNIGTRPTFDNGEVNCETYIFDYHGDLYGKTLRVSLLHFLRPEKKFASKAELEEQICRDITRAKEYLW
jgi:riboflavin kinase/FMN adenylyltransferase